MNQQTPHQPRGADHKSVRGRTFRRVAVGLSMLIVAIAGLAAGVFWHERIRGWIGRPQAPGAASQSTDQPASQLWTCGMHPQVIQDKPGDCPICHMKLTPMADESSAATAKAERTVKYWWDPMLSPPYISDKPGKSPMGMDLVPVYEDQVSGGSAVTIDPVVVQNMGVRTAEVVEGRLMQPIRAVGYLAEAQPNIHDVNLRVSGWIEKLYADTTGMFVEAGAPLFKLYSPEVLVGLKEYVLAKRSSDALPDRADRFALQAAAELYKSARHKLELWGISPDEYERWAALEAPPSTITFYSPISGHVTDKSVVEGAAVTAGDMALRIVDLTTLWIDAQVFERQLSLIRLGQRITTTVESFPGQEFEGEVVFVHPRIDPMTRTATVRMAVPNADLRLRPGMYATVTIEPDAIEAALLVPREAIIDSGARQIAFVAASPGRFEPRRVRLGLSGNDGMVQILEGLAPGEEVVTSGQFLLDSESRLREAIQKYLSAKRPSVPPLEHEPGHMGLDMPMAASPQMDALLSAYLGVAARLGALQERPAPVDADALRSAARAFQRESQGQAHQGVADDIAMAAAALIDVPIDRQRALFKPLSAAVVKLLKHATPSSRVADRLYVMHCPMAPGDWIQITERVANPYYATEMKSCGSVVRTVETGKGDDR